MKEVYPSRLRGALPLFVRASSLHVGAAAAAASLQTELVKMGFVSDHVFTRCFAIARLTPGTNLLALYASLGYRIASWRGALVALTIGAVVPALIAVLVAAAYVRFIADPLVGRFMAGARAGALAVLVWAAVRLARPVIVQHKTAGAVLAIGALTLAATGYLSSFVLLVVAGSVGAIAIKQPQ